MKIAIIAPEFYPALGGVGVYTQNLVNELIKDSLIELHILTTRRKNSIKPDIKNLNVHYVCNADDGFFYNLNLQLLLPKFLIKLHNQHNFDVIHIAGLVNMPDVFVDYSNINSKRIVTAHTTIDTQFDYKSNIYDFIRQSEPVEKFSRLTYPYIKFMQSSYIKKNANYLCVSKYVSGFLPDSTNKYLVFNGVDTKLFSPSKTKNKNSDMPQILFCGRLLHMKGVDIIISVAKEILKKRKVKFIFAGAGNITKWKKRFDGISEEYYSFLGYIHNNKMAKIYQNADIFVLPSFIESFPYTLLEAMSSSLPVIASRVGGIPELIQDAKTGYLINPNDKIDLKEKLLFYLDNPKLAKEIGRAARKKVIENYNIISMAKKTKEVYMGLK